MPSDLPPGQPKEAFRPGPPTIVHPALRRHWARDEPAAPQPRGKTVSRASGNRAWAATFANAVVALVAVVRVTRPPDPAPPVPDYQAAARAVGR